MTRHNDFEHLISEGLKRWAEAGRSLHHNVSCVLPVDETVALHNFTQLAQEEAYGVLTKRFGTCNINSRRRLRWR